jgi:hypothetical protein
MNIVSTLLPKCLALHKAVVTKGHNVHSDLTTAEHVKNSQTLKRNAIANEKGQVGWLIFLSQVQMVGRGPGPHRHGGAVFGAATSRQGRVPVKVYSQDYKIFDD